MTDGGPTGSRLPEPPAELTPSEWHQLAAVPSGAAALAGIAVALLLLGWVLIYALVYVPRGMVG